MDNDDDDEPDLAIEEPIQIGWNPEAHHDLLDVISSVLDESNIGTPGPQDITLTRDTVRDHLGINIDEIAQEAQAFLSGQGEWQLLADDLWWIQLYLCCHHCPEEGMALNTLARRHQVPSYHQRAVKLGITVPRGDNAALNAYKKSYRGQWLASLRIPVDTDHWAEIAIAQKILCLVALRDCGPC